MQKKPANLIYGVDDRPPLKIVIALAFQHIFFLASGLIVAAMIMREIGAPPGMAQNVICLSMIAGGIATILQALTKGPVGSGYLCTEGIDPTFVSSSIMAGRLGGVSLIFGMTVFAGAVECVLSRFMTHLRNLFPPAVTGVVLTMVGLNIVPIMIGNFFGLTGPLGSGGAVEPTNLWVAVITLAAMAGTNIWSNGKLRFYSVIIGIAAGYLSAYALGVLKPSDIENIYRAPLVSFPDLSHVGWSFNSALLAPFVVATVASTLKAVATLTMCQKINDADWKRPDLENIRKGTLADGLASVTGGLVGTLGQSLYASSAGLSVATGATSRRIAYFTGGIFIVLAFLPKLAAVFTIMPKPVMGGALVFMVCFMVISGIQIMTSRMIDIRKTFVIGVSLMFGLSVDIFPGLYRNVHPWVQPVFQSSLAVTTVLAVLLNLLFRIGIARRAVLELEPGVDSSKEVFDFLESRGGTWGARPEVIQKAKTALNEFVESAPYLVAEGKVRTEVSFDEFHLDIVIRYRGTPMEFPDVFPEGEALLEHENPAALLSARIISQYADRLKSEEADGRCTLRLRFDH